MISGPDGDKPVTLQSSQVPSASKFMTNLKIWLLYDNVFHILLEQSWQT